NLHRLEIAWRHRVDERLHVFAVFGGVSFDGHRAVPLVARENRDRGERRTPAAACRQLTEQPAARRPERQPDSNLALPHETAAMTRLATFAHAMSSGAKAEREQQD